MSLPPRTDRRTLLASLPAILLTGCIGNEDGASPQETPTPTPSAQEMLSDLPDPSPISTELIEFVRASDREAFADSHEYSYENGEIKVEIELEVEGEQPDQYLQRVTGSYGSTVVAFVAVEDLVRLAMADEVRIVRTPTDAQTGDGPQAGGQSPA